MSDLMRALIKSLIANGVKVHADEPVCFGGEKVSPAYNLDAIMLDFTKHDKAFEDKIAELKKDYKTVSGLLSDYQQENESLKQRIAELESKENVDLPFDPLECANYLITATYERETSNLERVFAQVPDKVSDDRYTVDDLEQIAEHLLVYCKHNKESE